MSDMLFLAIVFIVAGGYLVYKLYPKSGGGCGCGKCGCDKKDKS